MEIKCNLKWLIAKSGMNQNEVADRMGITKQMLSNWVNQRYYPRVDKAMKLAEILNTDISEVYEKIDNTDSSEKEEV